MDLLVVLGTSAAFGFSLYHHSLYGDNAGSNGKGYLYFEGATLNQDFSKSLTMVAVRDQNETCYAIPCPHIQKMLSKNGAKLQRRTESNAQKESAAGFCLRTDPGGCTVICGFRFHG